MSTDSLPNSVVRVSASRLVKLLVGAGAAGWLAACPTVPTPGNHGHHPDPVDLQQHTVEFDPQPIRFWPRSVNSAGQQVVPATGEVIVTLSNPGTVAVAVSFLALEADLAEAGKPDYAPLWDLVRFAPTADECLPWLSVPPSPGIMLTSRVLQPGESCHARLQRYVFDGHFSRGWLVAFGSDGRELARVLVRVAST
jgi:hypothetical protein